MLRVQLEPAFVLHSIAYRNTSLIVDLLTVNHGRVAVVARSARGYKSRFQGHLQSFLPLLVSYSGRNELKSLQHAELQASPCDLSGDALVCGFYLNELLVRLLARGDADAKLYPLYKQTLFELDKSNDIELTLRLFEKRLLMELGYGLTLKNEAISGVAIQPQCYYRFIPQKGFVKASATESGPTTFLGSSLLALAQEQLISAVAVADAKRLMRQALAFYLGPKPLKTREIFMVT